MDAMQRQAMAAARDAQRVPGRNWIGIAHDHAMLIGQDDTSRRQLTKGGALAHLCITFSTSTAPDSASVTALAMMIGQLPSMTP